MNDDEPVGPIGEIAAKRKSAGLPTYPSPPAEKTQSNYLPPEEENLLVIFAPVIRAMSRFFRFVSRFLFWSIVVAVGIQLQYEFQAYRIRAALEDVARKIEAMPLKK